MEKTVQRWQEEKQMSVYAQIIGIGGFGILIGSSSSSIAFPLAFMHISYMYMRDMREVKAAALGILLGSVLNGFFTAYLYALGFTIFFISIHVLRLWNKNIYRSLPFLCAILSIPYGLYTFGIQPICLGIAFCVFLLMRNNDEDYAWIQKRFVCTSTMYGILLLTITILCVTFLPEQYQNFLYLGGFLAIAFCCDVKTLVLFLLFHLMIIAQPIMEPSQVLLLGMVALWKNEKKQLLFGLFLYGVLLEVSLEMALFLCVIAIFVLLYKESALPFHVHKPLVDENSLSSQNILKTQIQNFSGIFQSLAQYYESICDVEAQMLAQMALALKYNADTLKKLEYQDHRKERILKALEGYQYDVIQFDYQEVEDGNVALALDIRNIQKSEIKQTLLPLMEVLTHESLTIKEVKHHRFQNGYHHIEMENQVPFFVDAYADSQKNMFESSGDSFSIFRFRNTMICMISDGMGSGEKASASSRLITNIFQRMVLSGIPKADTIRCINKLIQSDAYATLDVICFDLSAGKAYIFKSAACPTYLIRNHQLYEVSGSSLPVGIIASVEPDCFVADLKEGDTYLMVSDGIFMDEIYRWLKTCKDMSAKEDCESLMNILSEKQRLDDSTAVLSRILKAPTRLG